MLVDVALFFAIFKLLGLALGWDQIIDSDQEVPLYMNIIGWVLMGAFLGKDAFGGASIGKRCLDLKVINDITSKPINFISSVQRNAIFVFLLPSIYVYFQLARGKRLADGWANSRVVRVKYQNQIPFRVESAGN